MSEVLIKLEKLNRKLNKVEEIEERLETLEEREEKDIKDLKGEESKIEKDLIRIGTFSIKRSHALELARGAAGAFLGVGIGPALGVTVNFAEKLPWVNTTGILVFILLIVGVLIYRNDKEQIKESESVTGYIIKKITILYLISVAVVIIAMILFNNFPGWGGVLLKALIVGSYAPMSSAVAFTLI